MNQINLLQGKKEILLLIKSHLPDTAVVFYMLNLIELSQQPYEAGTNIAFISEDPEKGGSSPPAAWSSQCFGFLGVKASELKRSRRGRERIWRKPEPD